MLTKIRLLSILLLYTGLVLGNGLADINKEERQMYVKMGLLDADKEENIPFDLLDRFKHKNETYVTTSRSKTGNNSRVQFAETLFDFSSADTALVGGYGSISGEWYNMLWPHGVVVDAEGKIWVTLHNGYGQDQSGSSEFWGYNHAAAVAAMDTCHWKPLYCFMPDGSPASFSPITMLSFPDGSTDTLYAESINNGSGKGISLDMDGNILWSSWGTVYRINSTTGEGMYKFTPSIMGSITEAVQDPANGLIYVGYVVPNSKPLYMLDENLNLIGNAVDATNQIMRTLAVRTTADGTHLYHGSCWNGNGVFHFFSDDPLNEHFTIVDTLGNLDTYTDDEGNTYENVKLWASSLDWTPEGNLLIGSERQNYAGPLGSRWWIIDPITGEYLDRFGIPAPDDCESPYAYYPGGVNGPRGASFYGEHIYTVDFYAGTLDKWTYSGAIADISLSIPDRNAGLEEAISIPVIADYGFSNVAMIQLQISFCNDLLSYTGMSSDYGLSSGDVNDLGNQINIVWVYSGTPMEIPEGGTLIVLNFEVNASATEGQSCTLDFIGENNIGDPEENAFDLDLNGGTFTVIEGCTLSGRVSYCETDVSIENATISLTGDMHSAIMTNGSGDYHFDEVQGNVSVAASKIDTVGSIDGFDLLRLKNILLGIHTPSSCESWAAECNGTAPVNAFDLLRLKNFLLGLAVDPPIATWGFNPGNYSYSPIDADNADRDFAGVIFGDVTLSWGSSSSVRAKSTGEGMITFGDYYFDAAANIHVPITSDRELMLGMLDWSIEFDSTLFVLQSVSSRFLEQGDYHCSNGQVRIVWVYSGEEEIIHADESICELVLRPTRDRGTGKFWFGESNYLSTGDEEPYDPTYGDTQINLTFLAISENGVLPTETTLYSNYPNPFNPITTISYYLKESGDVTVQIFNLRGELQRSYHYPNQSSGFYQLEWNGKDSQGMAVPSGIYFYQLQHEGFSQMKRMVLMK